jgi:hypothetical protein
MEHQHQEQVVAEELLIMLPLVEVLEDQEVVEQEVQEILLM